MNTLKSEILDMLRQDARMTAAEMAPFVEADEATIASAIQELEAEGVLLKYTAIVNEEKLANYDGVVALIEIKITPMRDRGYDEIAKRIYRFDEVETVYLMSGAYDLMAIVRGNNIRQVSYFVSQKLATIDGVISTATHFVLTKYKESGVILEQREKEERLPVMP